MYAGGIGICRPEIDRYEVGLLLLIHDIELRQNSYFTLYTYKIYFEEVIDLRNPYNSPISL